MLSEDERMTLFNSHVQLAYHCANKFASVSNCELDDLKQEALTVLWDATAKFDPDRAAFSTFATTCICNHLKMFSKLTVYGRAIYLPDFSVAQKYIKESYASGISLNVILKENCASPSVQRLASMLYSRLYDTYSLDAPFTLDDNKGSLSLADMLPDSYDLAETVHSQIAAEAILNFFDTRFVPKILRRSIRDPQRTKLLLYYYRERFFGRMAPLSIIAQKVGVTPHTVGSTYSNWNLMLRRSLSLAALRTTLDF